MPTHGSNGQAGPGVVNGEELAVAAERAPDASERATSSVLALDGWGRLEPEPHVNGAAPAVVEAEPAAELEAEIEPEAGVETESPLEAEPADLGLRPEPSLDAADWRRRAIEVGGQRLERLIEEAQRLPWIGEHAGPGLQLFGAALVFGLAVGAVVGAALRWLELRSAPPAPPPPPDDLAERLHRAWVAFSTSDARSETAPRRRRSR